LILEFRLYWLYCP